MAYEEKRSSASKNSKGGLTAGPYLAKIVNHLDENYQCGLEVTLMRESGNLVADENQTYVVRYASPFYGCTAYEFAGKNNTYEDSQQSYGFWGVPPDTGVVGIVIFIDGRADLGFWICSIQDTFQNHMIPAIAGSKNYEDEDLDQAEHPLPVVEHNRKANALDKNLEIDKIPRAIHPFAYRIAAQGLIRDEFRGTSTSTTRRDIPNMVFGMSSPGPLNRNSKKKFLGNRQSKTPEPLPVNRLGGTQFVMDDGDDRYFRENTPSEGPPNYVPNPDGDKDIPYNEHFRIRTRTGHQILLHNSEDLIYIGNSKGTAWIELTSDGKIDIFATDSISLRTKQDFNFVSDRDVNFDVGRNFNIKVAGEMHTKVGLDHVLIVDRDQKIQINNRKDEYVKEEYRQRVTGHVKKVYEDDYTHNVQGRMDFRVAKGMSFTGGGGASSPDYAPYRGSSEDPASPCADNDPTPIKDVFGPTPDRIDIKIYKDMRIEHIGVNVDHTIRGYLKTKITGDVDISTDGTWEQTTQGNVDIYTPSNYKLFSGGNIDFKTSGYFYQEASGNFDVKAGGHIFNTSGGTNETKAGGNIIETAPQIHMNGPGASSAPGASTADQAEIALLPEEARTSAKATEFADLKVISMPDIPTPGGELSTKLVIVRRMPTPEPYPQHEHLDPGLYKPDITQHEGVLEGGGPVRYTKPDERVPAGAWRKYQKPKDNPF